MNTEIKIAKTNLSDEIDVWTRSNSRKYVGLKQGRNEIVLTDLQIKHLLQILQTIK